MTEERRPRHLLKFCLLGDAKVGKGALVTRLTEHRFVSEAYIPTIGVEIKLWHTPEATTQLWDLAGRELFRHLAVSFLKGTSGVMLCFSVHSRDSFEGLSSWITMIREHEVNHSKMNVVLFAHEHSGVGGELRDREVTLEEGVELARRENYVACVEGNALTGDGVDEAFELLLAAAIDREKVADWREMRRMQALAFVSGSHPRLGGKDNPLQLLSSFDFQHIASLLPLIRPYNAPSPRAVERQQETRSTKCDLM